MCNTYSQYSTRELELILLESVSCTISEIRLINAKNKRLSERKLRGDELRHMKKDGLNICVCPTCNKLQEDNVKDHCVKGRPDNSQTQCIHCNKWFTVTWDGDNYNILKGKVW